MRLQLPYTLLPSRVTCMATGRWTNIRVIASVPAAEPSFSTLLVFWIDKYPVRKGILVACSDWRNVVLVFIHNGHNLHGRLLERRLHCAADLDTVWIGSVSDTKGCGTPDKHKTTYRLRFEVWPQLLAHTTLPNTLLLQFAHRHQDDLTIR